MYTVAVPIPGGTSLTLGAIIGMHGKGRLRWHVCCNMTDTRFVAPCVGLVGICINTSNDRCIAFTFARLGRRRLRWRRRVSLCC
jgi:hypothetical protein